MSTSDFLSLILDDAFINTAGYRVWLDFGIDWMVKVGCLIQ